MGGAEAKDRRSTGLLRVPFVRRCTLELEDGSTTSGFIVNINVLGAYVAPDGLPRVGERVRFRFRTPGNEREVIGMGIVAWVNARQQHPVHSLPPGVGVKFLELSEEGRQRIERVVEDYVARHPKAR